MLKVTVKLSLCLIKNNSVKVSGGVEVQAHTFFSYGVVWGKWRAKCHGCFTLKIESQAGPYLGTLRPWAQEIFAPPLPYFFVFSYVQLSFQVQLISSTIPEIPLGKWSSCFGTSKHTNQIFKIQLHSQVIFYCWYSQMIQAFLSLRCT